YRTARGSIGPGIRFASVKVRKLDIRVIEILVPLQRVIRAFAVVFGRRNHSSADFAKLANVAFHLAHPIGERANDVIGSASGVSLLEVLESLLAVVRATQGTI